MIDRFFVARNSPPLASPHWTLLADSWFLPEAQVSVEVGEAIRLRKGLFQTCPFFYAATADFFIASTSWSEVVSALREHRPPLSCNPDYAWQYLQAQCPLTNQTFCRGVYALRSGEEVRHDFGAAPKISLMKYILAESDRKQSAPDLRQLIGASLQAVELKNTGFHLSAGLDSSILVILAREMNPQASVKAFSCKTLGCGAGDELPYVQRLASDYHLDLTIYDFTEIDLLADGRRLIDALQYPIAHPSHLTRFLLDEAIANENLGCIVTGRGADECLAGYEWHLPHYADPSTHKDRVMVTSEELLTLIFKQHQHSIIFSAWSQPGVLSLSDRLQYDWWTLFESWNVIDRNFEMVFKLNYLNPFLDKNLLEEVVFISESTLISGNALKPYLKEFFSQTYPSYILEFAKHGLTIDMNAYLRNYSSREILHAVFIESEFADRYLCRSAVAKLINQTLNGTDRYGWQIWSLYLCSLASQKLQSFG